MSQDDPDTPARMDGSAGSDLPARQWRALTRAVDGDSRMAETLRHAGPIPPAALVAVAAIFDTLLAAEAARANPDESEE